MSQMEIDIQKILKEIRMEIAALPKEDIPVLDNIPIRNEVDLMGARSYINNNWSIAYYRETGANKPKSFIKRVIRKVLCFLLVPMREEQNAFNANSVHILNTLMDQCEKQQQTIDYLQKQIRQIKKMAATEDK